MKKTKIAGLKKQYLKTRNACKVTFKLPKAAATDAKSVSVVGDFNNWNISAHPMRKLKSGDYTVTLDLEPGREYQFRYFIDESKWDNDWNADKYVQSPFAGNDNSVVIV
jgi:1,4-alpha-glucan branching enzyme